MTHGDLIGRKTERNNTVQKSAQAHDRPFPQPHRPFRNEPIQTNLTRSKNIQTVTTVYKEAKRYNQITVIKCYEGALLGNRHGHE